MNSYLSRSSAAPQAGNNRVIPVLALLSVIAITLALLPQAAAFAQDKPLTAAPSNQEASTLEPGRPIERELAGGQSHAYQVTLRAGQYLNVVVEQRGIDVVEVLFGPDGSQLLEVDGYSGARGLETVTWIATADGNKPAAPNPAPLLAASSTPPATTIRRLSLKEAFHYSVDVAMLQKPDPKPSSEAGKWLVRTETLLAPLQAALLALAVRRRFMR